MRPSHILLSIAAGMAWAFAINGTAQAHDQRNHAYAEGISVYLGVQSAAMVARAHPSDHPEEEMHDGSAVSRYDQHVFIAVFDAETGERIEDASAVAGVAPLGLAPVTRPLEPMVIAKTITYGNFFPPLNDGVYEIPVKVTRSDATQPTVIEFTYDHRTR